MKRLAAALLLAATPATADPDIACIGWNTDHIALADLVEELATISEKIRALPPTEPGLPRLLTVATIAETLSGMAAEVAAGTEPALHMTCPSSPLPDRP